MAPYLVIENPGFMVFAEWVVRENPFIDEKKQKPEIILRVTTKNKGFLKRLKETFSTSHSETRDNNVSKAHGHYYGTIPNPVGIEEEKTPPRLLTLRFSGLKVHLVAKYPDKLIVTSPYMKLEITQPPPSFKITSMNGRRLV